MSNNVVVIGAGAAGIIAAWRAAELGAKVTLLEKTPRVGTKILISGGGKCNITHDCSVQELLHAFRQDEAKFLKAACYRFTKDDILEMLTSHGLEVYTREDGRVFPVRQTAKDVVAILATYLNGVDMRLNTPVLGLEIDGDGRLSVRLPHGSVVADSVVVAVGGSSYPNSGTTGDGWKWARDLGHSIVKPMPALAPIYLHMDERAVRRAGVALRDCVLKARVAGKEIVRWRGDLLFTHHGISGPCALGISRTVVEHHDVRLEVDLCPDLDHGELKERLTHYAMVHPRRLPSSFLGEFMPEAVTEDFQRGALDAILPVAQLPKGARNAIIQNLKAWPLGAVRTVPLEKGEVVAGGVNLQEVDPSTMQSKLVDGLFLCGEVLDIAGPVGGYNLQAAFSTGFVAGTHAAGYSRNPD